MQKETAEPLETGLSGAMRGRRMSPQCSMRARRRSNSGSDNAAVKKVAITGTGTSLLSIPANRPREDYCVYVGRFLE
jgi:hypothetical protein